MEEVVMAFPHAKGKALIINEKHYQSIHDFTVTQKDLEKASKELDETESKKQSSIQELRERLESDKEFRYCTTDDYLLSYLRFQKFNCNKAFDTIRKAHSLRMKYREMWSLPPNLKDLLNKGFLKVLPYRDQEGRVIVFLNWSNWKLEEMTLEDMLQMANPILELITKNPHCQIHGSVFIHDFKEASASHAIQLVHPKRFWFLINLLQNSYAYRVKLIILMNCPRLVEPFVQTALLFLKKKIVDRVKIIGSDVTAIHQFVDPCVLPETLGGTLDDGECKFTENVMENLPYLQYLYSFEENTNATPT